MHIAIGTTMRYEAPVISGRKAVKPRKFQDNLPFDIVRVVWNGTVLERISDIVVCKPAYADFRKLSPPGKKSSGGIVMLMGNPNRRFFLSTSLDLAASER